MEYNTTRSKMSITEYGRNIQKMIEFAVTIEDREKRNRLARIIIGVMGQLNPHLRDVSDFKHKLWDHLLIMSNFKLDIDSPFPTPTAESLAAKTPKRLNYPHNNFKYRHYGKNIEILIDKVSTMDAGQEKENLTLLIASQLKKSYLNWNRDSVTDEVICEHLNQLSNEKLQLPSDTKIHYSSTDHFNKNNQKKKLEIKSNKGSVGQNSSSFNNKNNSRFNHKKNVVPPSSTPPKNN